MIEFARWLLDNTEIEYDPNGPYYRVLIDGFEKNCYDAEGVYKIYKELR